MKFQHPFGDGVFRTSRAKRARTADDFLREFAEHYAECDHSLCMGYQTAFLIAYFTHLSHSELSELVALVRQFNVDPFLQRAQYFIEREGRNGCVPQEVFIEELKEPSVVVGDLTSNREEVRTGRKLANTRGSRVHIRGFTSMGETFLVPGIAPKTNLSYLSVRFCGSLV